jgi:hypothetical protein
VLFYMCYEITIPLTRVSPFLAEYCRMLSVLLIEYVGQDRLWMINNDTYEGGRCSKNTAYTSRRPRPQTQMITNWAISPGRRPNRVSVRDVLDFVSKLDLENGPSRKLTVCSSDTWQPPTTEFPGNSAISPLLGRHHVFCLVSGSGEAANVPHALSRRHLVPMGVCIVGPLALYTSSSFGVVPDHTAVLEAPLDILGSVSVALLPITDRPFDLSQEYRLWPYARHSGRKERFDTLLGLTSVVRSGHWCAIWEWTEDGDGRVG